MNVQKFRSRVADLHIAFPKGNTVRKLSTELNFHIPHFRCRYVVPSYEEPLSNVLGALYTGERDDIDGQIGFVLF